MERGEDERRERRCDDVIGATRGRALRRVGARRGGRSSSGAAQRLDIGDDAPICRKTEERDGGGCQRRRSRVA